jgi:hypothetical protein
MLTEKIIVGTAGVPVQFPHGKPASDVRLSTSDNTGTVYLAYGSTNAKDAKHRFAIDTNKSISLKLKNTDLSSIWLDADTGGDGVSILCELKEI